VLERERKYRLAGPDFARLKQTLDQLAVLERREIQDTIHFADGSRRIERLNLRLRTIDARQELTVKGPRLEGGRSKVRMEHTVAVDGDIAPILAALGLVPAERYRKRTAIYALDGAVVSLDDVEGVGRFCEIEAADDATIERAATKLGLSAESLERRGYARLVRSADSDAQP
jgi:predicted adenylyl cyclase CyaB